MSRNDEPSIRIRKIKKNDAEAIAELSSQFGYSVEMETIYDRISSILNHSDHIALAAWKGRHMVGYLHAIHTLRLTSQPFTEIVALVVAEKERGKGVGTHLVTALESQLKNPGKLRVRCNVQRHSAHRFYEKLKYRLLKEQKVFEKSRLSISSPGEMPN